MKSALRFFTLSIGLVLCLHDVAAEAQDKPGVEALPNPLTLQQALLMAKETHPQRLLANDQLEQARMRREIRAADSGFKVNLELKPQIVKLSTDGSITGDSYLQLGVSKTVYDFGYLAAVDDAMSAEVRKFEHQYRQAQLQHQLEVMQAFFNVILADMRYTFENEEMSQLYVKYARLRDQHELGMLDEVAMLQAKNRYQEQLDIRNRSDTDRHFSRQHLALKLDRPQQLPQELVTPEYMQQGVNVPDFDETYKLLVGNNLLLLAMQENVNALQKQYQAEKNRYAPKLSIQFSFNQYERELAARSDLNAGLLLDVPLYLGGKKPATRNLAYQQYLAGRHQLQLTEYDLREKLLKLVHRLEQLKTELRTANERIQYQDRKLDRQRGFYELEIQATMGSSMADVTRAQWLLNKVLFDIMLTHAQLNVLLGRAPLTLIKEKKDENTTQSDTSAATGL